MMREGIKVALDPTPRQLGLLASHAGAARFAFNAGLLHVQSQLCGNTTCQGKGKADWTMPALRRWWNEWKNELAPWWRENSKEAYTSGLQSLADAYSNYFSSRDGKRKGRRMGYPRLRRKSRTTSKFTYTTGSFGIADDHGVKLPRIGRIHCMENIRRLAADGHITRVTVSRHAGRWYASFAVERDDPQPSKQLHGSIGVDLGVKRIATFSDGATIENPHRMDELARRQRRTARRLSRRAKGSRHWVESKHESERLANRLANQRRDLLDKTTTMLARAYADISIEDLNVQGMTRTPKPKPDPNKPGHYLPNGRKAKAGLNKRVLDAGFGMFRAMLAYKCAQTGARLHIIDRWYPSSKTCSNCGTVKAKLPLDERTYHCDACGLVIDRDLNAAVNINVAGSAPETINARGGHVRPELIPATPETPHRDRNANQAATDNGMRLGADSGNGAMQETLALATN